MSAPPPAALTDKLAAYSFMVKTTLAPLQRARGIEHARAAAAAASLHERAEALAALCAHEAAAAAPAGAAAAAPYTPLIDLGLGVRIAGAVEAGAPLLVDVGAGVHLAMAPREALVHCRRAAAEARSEAALAEKALQDVSRDLASACEALILLQQLEARGGGGL
jgi:hypothetical protein